MDLTGLEIQVVVVRFPLTGLALGFLAPRANAKVRSNLAAELPGQAMAKGTQKNSKQL